MSIHSLPKPPYYCPTYSPSTSNISEYEIPRTYVEEYSSVPPLLLVTTGFSGHGKTTYLSALTLVLENLCRIWSGTVYDYADDFSRDQVLKIRAIARQGRRVEPTPLINPRPILLSVYGMPEFKSNCIMLTDMAGQFFDNARHWTEPEGAGHTRFIKSTKNIWMFISLYDLLPDETSSNANVRNERMNDLLSNYVRGMTSIDSSVSGRNLIVVYTKADKLLNDPPKNLPEIPTTIRNYITGDKLKNITNNDWDPENASFSLPEYLTNMQRISDELAAYTKQIPGGSAFINNAEKRHGMKIYFAVTSAQGIDLDERQEPPENISRHRVIDPFLWALLLKENPEAPHTIRLAIDASSTSSKVYEENVVELASDLGEFGEVHTYFLGHRQASVPDQRPPDSPPKSAGCRPCLIGPLLERSKPDDFIVAITATKILDLDDFKRSDFSKRLLVVSLSEEPIEEWDWTVAIREKDALARLTINQVTEMIKSSSIL